MGSCKQAVMGLVAQAVSDQVTKHFVTFLALHVITGYKFINFFKA